MKPFVIALLACLAIACPGFGQSPAAQIRSLREQSNAAIARHDVERVVSLLDVEYQITAGSGALHHDRAAEPEAWAAEFARADDVSYVRTPEVIEVSSSGTRAAEIGMWSGSWTTSDGPRKSGGRYAVHWRLVDGSCVFRHDRGASC